MLEQVGDEAAVYSPLARGASVLSDRGYLEEDAGGTPRSVGGPPGAPLVSDGAGTPRSPWWVPAAAAALCLWGDKGRKTCAWLLPHSGTIAHHPPPLQCRASTHERVYAAAVEMDASRSPLGRPTSLRSSPLGGSAASSPTRQPRAVRSVQFGGGAGEEEAVAVQRVGRRPSFTQQQAPQYGAVPGASPSGRRVLREAESIAAKGPWEEALRGRDAWEAAAAQPAPRRMPRA